MTQLSIIVPIYNVEKYLGACLDSLTNQTLKDIEIICVDDCGTDNSVDIVKQYMQKDNRIHLIHHEQNQGLAAARNTGLKYASSELIAFVDSDDIVLSNAYETALSKMAPDIDIVCFGIQVVGSQDKTAQKSDDGYYKIKYTGKTKITDEVLYRTDVSACNKIFRKSLIDKYGLSFPAGLRYEDAYFFNAYGMRSKMAFFISDKFYHYMRREDSIMHTTFTQKIGYSIDHVKIAIKLYEYLKQNQLFATHEYYFGQIFLDYVDFALRHEHHKKGKEAIFDVAIDFLQKERLSFDAYFDLYRNYKMLHNRTFGQKYTKRLLGLVKIKESKSKKTIYFMGIPIWRIKYRPECSKYYLLSCVHLFTRKTNNRPLVSVLMPVYNAQAYIKEAIDSILNQTYTNFEFIIINDGSLDNSVDIIRHYADPRIVFIDNQDNKGLVTVLNHGLDIAKGKYIARMDADDISLPNRLEKQVSFMERHSKVGVLGSWFHIFGGGFDRIETKLRYPTLKDMIKTSPVGHPTAMFRKSVFDKYHVRYDDKWKYAEDYELWIRANKYTQIANLQEVLLEYRWSGDNVSNKHEYEQLVKSQAIKQKIKRQIKKKKCYLVRMPFDDTPLLNELKSLGKFSYMPNSGNMGDMLIASATMSWFDEQGLQWERTKENEQPDYFVYGGGGAWLDEWIEYLKPTMDIMCQAKKVVILPSSFNNVPEFVSILDERFVVFCREKKSYDYLIGQNTKAKIILDHDMALRMNDKISKKLKAPNKQLEKYFKKLKENCLNLSENVRLFRKDTETAGHYDTDLDLSDTFGWFSQFEPRENIDFAANVMVNTLYHFKTVKTDRLHVGIAAALSGVQVELYDNSYGKLSGVYNQSLRFLPNVQFKK